MSLTRLVADLAVDQVGADQHLAGARLERVEVDVPAAQARAVAVELGDPVGVDEDPPPLAAGDEPDDAAGSAALVATHAARDDDEVFDRADLGATGVEQRAAASPGMRRSAHLTCRKVTDERCGERDGWPRSSCGGRWRCSSDLVRRPVDGVRPA